MLRIRQYVYFAIRSETLSADEVTKQVGLNPDRTVVRGSRKDAPARPAGHAWEIWCDEPGLPIDEQVEAVLDRLRPHEKGLAEVTERPDCSAVLQLVRHLDDKEGEPERLSDPAERLQKLAGQHQLLGWHLTADDLSLLARLGVPIDADEYG